MTNIARTGQTLLIAASGMLFAAFTSAMVVRRGLGGDWVAPTLPAWIWATLLFAPIASWLIHNQRIKGAMALGSALVAAQVALLAQLQMGVIGEAFCSVLIAAHAAHAAAGVAALARFGARAAIFWHFVGALWIYVLFLFGVWA
jgi:cytochrome c oxidase subunit III